MAKIKPIQFFYASLFLFFTWGLAQWVVKMNGMGTLSSLLFSFLFCTVAGVFVPLSLKRNYDLKYSHSKPNWIVGIVALLITLTVGIVLSGALKTALSLNYSFLVLVKYKLLFFPMSLALSLFAFLLIPNVIPDWETKISKKILLVLVIGVFFFIGFWVDQLFEIELAVTMGMLGILFGICYLFIRNFWVLFPALYLTMLVNTLSENKYNDYPFWIVVSCSVLCLFLILLYRSKK